MSVLSAIVLGACVALPVQDRPSPGMVSVETVQADDEVCVRVGNGTADPLYYGQVGEERTNLWLDRRIWAGRWRTQSSAPARRTVFFSVPGKRRIGQSRQVRFSTRACSTAPILGNSRPDATVRVFDFCKATKPSGRSHVLPRSACRPQ